MTLEFVCPVIGRELGNPKKHSANQLGQSASIKLEKTSKTQAIQVSGSTSAEMSVQGSANCMQHQGLPHMQHWLLRRIKLWRKKRACISLKCIKISQESLRVTFRRRRPRSTYRPLNLSATSSWSWRILRESRCSRMGRRHGLGRCEGRLALGLRTRRRCEGPAAELRARRALGALGC